MNLICASQTRGYCKNPAMNDSVERPKVIPAVSFKLQPLNSKMHIDTPIGGKV